VFNLLERATFTKLGKIIHLYVLKKYTTAFLAFVNIFHVALPDLYRKDPHLRRKIDLF